MSSGYTLIELLVIIAILAIIATFAVPVALTLADGMRLQSDTRNLLTQLRQIEQGAVDRERTIVVRNDPVLPRLVTDDGYSLELPDGSTAHIQDGADIVFFPDGSSNGGLVSVSRENRVLNIRVGWLLGDLMPTDPE